MKRFFILLCLLGAVSSSRVLKQENYLAPEPCPTIKQYNVIDVTEVTENLPTKGTDLLNKYFATFHHIVLI